MNTNHWLIVHSFGLALIATPAFSQGDLTPPGAPAPTFKTLQQVEPRIPIDASHTPGDANSIYRIADPGSYYLVGNITKETRGIGAATKESAIEVGASGVTLDLNGFRISGAGSTNSVHGVNVSSAVKNFTIRNGTISDCGADGIQAVNARCSLYENLCLDNNGGNGLVAGDECTVRGCRATANGAIGITVGSFGTVVECQARSNPKAGISGSTRCVISKCTSGDATSGDGIIADSFCVVDHCTVFNAFGFGIKTTQRPLISDCVVDSNGHPDVNGVSGGILLHFAGMVKHCVISFNLVGIEVLGSSDGGGASIIENQIDSNTGGGIDVLSGGNRIDGNTMCCNGGPAVRTHTGGNFIVRNQAVSNNGASPDYVLGGNDTVGPVVNGAGSINSLPNGSSPWANFQQ